MNELDQPIKTVIIVASTLGIGQAANRAAVLATGLAAHVPDMIGTNLITHDHVELLGVTQIPIPILCLKPELSFFDLMDRCNQNDLKVIVFLSQVQGMQSYEEYKDVVSRLDFKQLDIDAIAVFGDRKAVTSVTGNLPSLR